MTEEQKNLTELFSPFPDQYTPAIKYQEKKNTYLWLQVACKGDQEDFDEKYLQQSPLKIYAGINHTFDIKIRS